MSTKDTKSISTLRAGGAMLSIIPQNVEEAWRLAKMAYRSGILKRQKVKSIDAQIADLEEELETEVATITNKWATAANTVTTMKVGLEKTDVKVTQICLAWLPVAT